VKIEKVRPVETILKGGGGKGEWPRGEIN
jgi:hypothetical protein